MESKKYFFCAVTLVFVCLFGGLLVAQDFYIKEEEGETRFVQRLSWKADEKAWRYEVVIEELITYEVDRQEHDATEQNTTEDINKDLNEEYEAEYESLVEKMEVEYYQEILSEITEEDFLEVSLTPGNYRYKVTARDFLDRPGLPSEWTDFNVLPAKQPEVQGLSPAAFYLDKDKNWTIELSGENLLPDTEVYLVNSRTNKTVTPNTYTADEPFTHATLEFDIRQFTNDDYTIHLKNPCGLQTTVEDFSVGFYKPIDMYVGLAYTPLFSLYGKTKHPYFFPLGAMARFGIVPLKKYWGHIGVELGGSWNHISFSKDDEYVKMHTGGAELNALYQKWNKDYTMAFTARTGAGFTGGEVFLCPRIQAGVGFLWAFSKPFVLEAGIDYVHWFAKGYSDLIRPWIGINLLF